MPRNGGEMPFINIADIVDPTDPEKRTFRQINAATKHAIPIGALVELESGVRMFVAEHDRDCDMTPLYALAPSLDTHKYKWFCGWPEESLKIVS